MSIEKRLERVEAILDARGLDWDHPRVASDHFAGANKMVAEEPAKEEEPAEPEYREPVLPADVGKECEFSDDSISWEEDDLIGWRANLNTFNWESARDSYRYARIKKDA